MSSLLYEYILVIWYITDSLGLGYGLCIDSHGRKCRFILLL